MEKWSVLLRRLLERSRNVVGWWMDVSVAAVRGDVRNGCNPGRIMWDGLMPNDHSIY